MLPIILFLLLSPFKTLALSNSFIPDAPVINFKLPIFNPEGYRSWFAKGDQGIYINEDRVDVINLNIAIFSGNIQESLEAIIESPKATILINENKANGDDLIQVKGESYHLSGKHWAWNGNLKKMSINKDVKVIFNQSLNAVLSYENQ